ncbi:MAG: hypothetical protein E7501_02845 [Ruminococcus sp.]|nr:hypothetical protein [Ruminococcus sp.]
MISEVVQMKISNTKRITAAAISAALLLSAMPCAGVTAANVQETPDLQLQTILIDNNGKDWTTLSWGGATMTPNTNWTSLTIRDYCENGSLDFEVKSNGSAAAKFQIGLVSRCHGENVTIRWTDLDAYKSITAPTEWTKYSLPLKTLLAAFPDSGFRPDHFWYVYVGGVPSGTTLSFRNMTISSPDDERQYPMIKVNQVGYFPDAEKTARVSCFEKFGTVDGKTYQIINAQTEKVVLTGKLEAGTLDETFSGERVHIVRFDELTTPGTYYIRIPDAGLDASARSPRDVEEELDVDTLCSAKFTIGNHVYDDLFRDLMQYYYYQRQGIDLDAAYAGEFARENLHPDDVTVKRWSDRNNPDAETFDVSGGWYDAGDYGKYTSPGAGSVEDLLLAYELYEDVFTDVSAQIPEADPANPLYVDAPAILTEVKWELDMLLKLEHRSKDGSFYVAANYKDDVIYLEDTRYSTSTHQSDASETDLRCHLSTADMAAVLAHAYIVYRDIPVYADFAEECLAVSLRAWDWVTNPANALHTSIGAANRTYTFTEENLARDKFWAAGAIYRAVSLAGGDASEYEQYLIDHCGDSAVTNCFTSSSVGYSHGGRSFLGYFHYLYGNKAADASVAEVFSKYESWRTRTMKYDNWGTAYPDWGYWWGSNKVLAQSAMTVVLGDLLLGGEEALYTDAAAAEHAFHYLLGVNPVAFSYVSGHGENSVENIYSAIYSKDARLEPYRCPDGYFTEGTNYYDNRHLSKFDGKCYLDSDVEYTTNENTIYGNAAMIFLTAAIMTRHASESVEGDVNADGTFSVADVVMLQKWLIRAGELTDPAAGDLCGNDLIDGFDLTAMKRRLLPVT